MIYAVKSNPEQHDFGFYLWVWGIGWTIHPLTTFAHPLEFRNKCLSRILFQTNNVISTLSADLNFVYLRYTCQMVFHLFLHITVGVYLFSLMDQSSFLIYMKEFSKFTSNRNQPIWLFQKITIQGDGCKILSVQCSLGKLANSPNAP